MASLLEFQSTTSAQDDKAPRRLFHGQKGVLQLITGRRGSSQQRVSPHLAFSFEIYGLG
jgi:hypothetical protein